MLGLSPATMRSITPSWEPKYEDDRWQGFLAQRGYEPLNCKAFVKYTQLP